MDVSNLTVAEAEALIQQLRLRIEQLRIEERDEQTERTARIGAAISELDALLGPEGAAPGVDSIRAVRGYDGQTMADNAAIAFPLAFQGLEILADVVRDIASMLSSE